MAKKISFQRELKVPPAEVFRAFTNSMACREWLCDVATIDPREGGRVYLWWDHGSFIAGKFTQFVPGEMIEISCQGCYEPTPTKISISLKKTDRGTQLTLVESGFSNDDDGQKLQKRVEHRWEQSLDNLVTYSGERSRPAGGQSADARGLHRWTQRKKGCQTRTSCFKRCYGRGTWWKAWVHSFRSSEK